MTFVPKNVCFQVTWISLLTLKLHTKSSWKHKTTAKNTQLSLKSFWGWRNCRKRLKLNLKQYARNWKEDSNQHQNLKDQVDPSREKWLCVNHQKICLKQQITSTVSHRLHHSGMNVNNTSSLCLSSTLSIPSTPQTGLSHCNQSNADWNYSGFHACHHPKRERIHVHCEKKGTVNNCYCTRRKCENLQISCSADAKLKFFKP